MNIMKNNELNKEVVDNISSFLKLKNYQIQSKTTKMAIQELCVVKLCRVVGLTGYFNYQSEFFSLFSNVMGEAICNHLGIRICIACDELRLIKYERINLIDCVKEFLLNESLEEAFLDAFELMDKFKYIIPQLKKA